jgi:lipid-A-disaccharide synthase-like uncharacterized protein
MTEWFTWENAWVLIGLLGQGIFMGRMVVQWWASERAGRSVVPVAFWYLSIGGSLITLAYAIYRKDPVFISSQLFGMIVYVRNLYLIFAERSAAGRENGSEPPSATK